MVTPCAGNVYDGLPKTAVRSVSIVLMIIHQCFAYAMFIMPVHHMWEKLIRTHDKPYWIRLPSRLPVGQLPHLISLPVPMTSINIQSTTSSWVVVIGLSYQSVIT